MNRWKVEQRIVMKALKDPAFKKQLLSKPKETLMEFLKEEKGVDQFNVRVIEEKQNEWVLPLPHVPTPDGVLTDAEVEKLYGGACSACYQNNVTQG